jgi:type IV pilus assembly protein PilV
MNYVPSHTNPRQAGFSMMEILVTIVVLSIGLLGLAGLQMTGLQNNQSAYYRTIAMQQAYDMADRIRANPVAQEAGDYDSISGTPSDPGCISSGCTPTEMQEYDAHAWNTDNDELLPAGTGTVERSGNFFIVTVMWDDDRTGATGTNCGGDPQVDLKCFTLSFQP